MSYCILRVLLSPTLYILYYIYTNYLSSLILVCVAKACVENNLLCDMLLLPSPWLRVSFRCNHYVIYHNLCHNCGRNAPCFGCYSTNRLATLINPWLYWGVSLFCYYYISYHPIKYLVLTYSQLHHYQLGLQLLTILHFLLSISCKTNGVTLNHSFLLWP